MAQTMYIRPYPNWLMALICMPLAALAIVLAIVKGLGSYALFAALVTNLFFLTIFTLLDPNCVIKSRRKMSDGSIVRVRRPLIGFKKCERKVGVTGGYEVRIDGYRYEKAYIRI